MASRYWIMIGACAAAVSISACQSLPADRFYTLSASEGTAPPHPVRETQAYSIAVGPATIPEMIDRPQLVVRRGQNEVAVIDQHRWAEPLRTGIPRAIAAELRARLTDAQVMTSASSASRDATYRILLDIERFESNPGTGVTIHAVWRIRQGTANVLVTRQSRIDEPVSSDGYDELVSAHGRALAEIGKQMADALQVLEAAKRNSPLKR